MNIWMAVTADKYELPLVVCDTARELAEKCGVSKETVKTAAYRGRNGKRSDRKYVRVIVEGNI